MRLFLAVDLPARLKERISKVRIDDFIGKRVTSDLKKGTPVRWDLVS